MLTVTPQFVFFFFFNDTATTEIYTLSLHDALPISRRRQAVRARGGADHHEPAAPDELRARPRHPHRGERGRSRHGARSEEHTSELQSRLHLVCRLLLEKKKKIKHIQSSTQA